MPVGSNAVGSPVAKNTYQLADSAVWCRLLAIPHLQWVSCLSRTRAEPLHSCHTFHTLQNHLCTFTTRLFH
jgi:hypothetical protein